MRDKLIKKTLETMIKTKEKTDKWIDKKPPNPVRLWKKKPDSKLELLIDGLIVLLFSAETRSHLDIDNFQKVELLVQALKYFLSLY